MKIEDCTKTRGGLPLTDWQDKVPWDCLEDWIQWVAKTQCGRWAAFAQKPNIQDDAYWVSNYANVTLYCIKMPVGPDDWREAIAQRPGRD